MAIGTTRPQPDELRCCRSPPAPRLPAEFALFLTFEQDKASIEEASSSSTSSRISPVLADFQRRWSVQAKSDSSPDPHHDGSRGSAVIHTKFLGVDGVHLLGAEVDVSFADPTFVQFALSVQSRGALAGTGGDQQYAPTFALGSADDVWCSQSRDVLRPARQYGFLPGGLRRHRKNKPNSDDRTYLIGTDVMLRWKSGAGSWPYVGG